MIVNNMTRIGYVLKRYPRYSETFIVNEILAHEAAGLQVEIFALLPCKDSHFQDVIARVQAKVNYLPGHKIKAIEFWDTLKQAAGTSPNVWPNLHQAEYASSRDVYQASILACLARQKGITHFHAHFGTAATTVARLTSLFTGIPYTFTAHAKDIFHENVQPNDLRCKLADAASVITVSDYNVNHLVTQFGVAASRVERVYNGLELDRFPYRAPQERPPRIIYVGRLVEKKGVSHLIQACSILVASGLEFECQIVGSGELEPELRAQIDNLKLQKEVKLVGPRPQEEIAKMVQGAAVFAAPCVIGSDGNRDGLPTVLLEAMALGTPCVSTNVTGIPEVIHDGVTGLLVRQGNAAELASALKRLLKDSELRVKLAARARSLIEKNFDVHQNAAKLRSIFSEVKKPEPLRVLEVA